MRPTPVEGPAPLDQRQLSTQVLIRLAQGGDAGALDHLVKKTYPEVLHAARAALRGRVGGLRSRLETQDLAQSAYREAVQCLPAFRDRGRGSFQLWLRGILRNKIRRSVSFFLARRRSAVRERPLDQAAGSPGGDRPPIEQLLDGERRERLEQALRGLPERSRLVITCRYFQDLSFKDIGARMGVTEEAAQMLCHRALLKLRASFSGSG